MGLRETFKNAGEAIVDALGNVPITVTYVVKGDRTYTPSTGATTSTDTLYTGIKAVEDTFASREIDNEVILRTDKLLYIADNDLTPTPEPDDEVVASDVT